METSGRGSHTEPKKISLSLTGRYASTWGTWEGVRELIQNWHDGLYDEHPAISPCHNQSEIVYKETRKDTNYEIYEATSKSSSDLPVGFLIVDKIQSKLHLINRNTSLHKKVLLLGYSKKSETANVIGQFGEGLKIGALALVREGRLVTMTTSKDVWHFDLSHDEHFEEKVLTVFVSEREILVGSDSEVEDFPVKREAGDTVTTVTLEFQEWLKYKFRFLFLQSPQDQVKNEIGSLLLDIKYQGQLYVKGVWVSDLSGEDLVTGVNFVNLRIDRDRNAVPRPSEIDHMVSCMWVKALETTPSLAKCYFTLLQKETNRDVRQALEYASESFLKLIADEFYKEYGENSFAIDAGASQTQLDQIRQELNKKAVICNSTLLNLLRKSGRHRTLEEELFDLHPRERKVVPIMELKSNEQSVISHALKLVRLGYPKVSLRLVDVVDVPCVNNEGCSVNGHRYEVPSWMIRDFRVGHIKGCGQLDLTQCMCREARIACSLSLAVESQSENSMDDIFTKVPPSCNHRLLRIVAPLASQLCGQAQEYFCGSLHTETQKGDSLNIQHSECAERERSLHGEIEQLRIKLTASLSSQSESLKQLQGKIEQAEQNAVKREMEYLNMEHQIQAEVQQRLDSVTEKYNKKIEGVQREKEQVEEQLLAQRNETEYWREKAKEYSTQLSEMKTSMERQHDVFLQEMMHYVNLCKNRTETLNKLCTDQLGEEDTDSESKEKLQLLLTLSSMISEELQKEKFLCMVCLAHRKEVVLVPCGHYSLCETCSIQIRTSSGQCPLCKVRIRSTITVYS